MINLQERALRSGIGWAQPLPVPRMTPERLGGLRNNVVELFDIHDKALAKASAVRNSRDFTAAGRAAQMKALGAQVDAELRAAVGKVNYDYHIGQLEKAMAPKKTEIDAVTQLRHAEIRTRLLTMNDIERTTAYREAALTGDAELLLAVETAPRLFNLVPQAVIAEMRDARLAAEFPVEFETLTTWRVVKASYADAAQAVRGALRSAGLIFPDDPAWLRAA